MFAPDLQNPKIEEPIDQGRKRVDISLDNRSERGFFFDLTFRHNISCAVVFAECKNYSHDLSNPEYDQLSGRFRQRSGMVGFIFCRDVTNKPKMIDHCKDRFINKNELIIVVDDETLIELVNAKLTNTRDGVSEFLHSKFRPLLLNK